MSKESVSPQDVLEASTLVIIDEASPQLGTTGNTRPLFPVVYKGNSQGSKHGDQSSKHHKSSKDKWKEKKKKKRQVRCKREFDQGRHQGSPQLTIWLSNDLAVRVLLFLLKDLVEASESTRDRCLWKIPSEGKNYT